MAIYSWMGLPVQIHMTDENAAAYNRVADQIATISVYTPPEDWTIKANPADMEVWNKVAEIINGMVELNGGELPYETDDVKSGHMIKIP